MPNDRSDHPTSDAFIDVERLHADGKFAEAKVLFEKIHSPAECEADAESDADTVTIGPTGIVYTRSGQTIFRVIDGGVKPAPFSARREYSNKS
jgi:hypothetical protein